MESFLLTDRKVYRGVEYKIRIHYKIKEEASHQSLGLRYIALGYAHGLPAWRLFPVPLLQKEAMIKKSEKNSHSSSFSP